MTILENGTAAELLQLFEKTMDQTNELYLFINNVQLLSSEDLNNVKNSI